MYGAAWSTTATLILFSIFLSFVFIWRKLGIQPFSKKTILIIIAAVPAIAAGYFFQYLFEQARRHIYVHTFMDATMRSRYHCHYCLRAYAC